VLSGFCDLLDFVFIFSLCNKHSSLTGKIGKQRKALEGLISPTCLCKAFTQEDHKSARRQSSHQCLFALLESSCTKTVHKMLVKSTPTCLFTLEMKWCENAIINWSTQSVFMFNDVVADIVPVCAGFVVAIFYLWLLVLLLMFMYVLLLLVVLFCWCLYCYWLCLCCKYLCRHCCCSP